MYAKIAKFQSVYTNQQELALVILAYLLINFTQMEEQIKTLSSQQTWVLFTFQITCSQSPMTIKTDEHSDRQADKQTDTQPVELARQTGSW